MKTYITKIGDLYHPYSVDPEKDQVYSVGNDCPYPGATLVARWSIGGIKYVSHGRSKSAAVRTAKKYGEYGGECPMW